MRILAKLTFRSSVLASLSTNKPKACSHDENQLALVCRNGLIRKPGERVKASNSYKSPQSTRVVNLKGKPNSLLSLDLEMHT